MITGLGAVTPIGIGTEPFWSSLLEGRSGVKKIESFDVAAYASRIAGEVPDFKPHEWMAPAQVPKTARVTQFALAAAKMAIEDAALHLSEEDSYRAGVAIGTGLGGMVIYEDQLRALISTGNPRRVHPWSVPLGTANAASAEIAIAYGIRGPNITLSTACSSGAHAVGYGFDLIRFGRADMMVAGGTEACLLPGVLAGFCSLRALSVRNDAPERASRPFDKKRDGFVMAEGAGMVVLESLEGAQRRGATIYAEVVGYGASCEATHMVSPEMTGSEQARVMEMALRDGRIELSEVDYISAHGTSTPHNDLAETRAIKMLFKDHARGISINSTKSMIGHTIGAAGAIEAIVCALTLRRGVIHPTINYEEPDPECDLDYTPNKARERKVRIALSNSFGFGGNDASLVMRAFA